LDHAIAARERLVGAGRRAAVVAEEVAVVALLGALLLPVAADDERAVGVALLIGVEERVAVFTRIEDAVAALGMDAGVRIGHGGLVVVVQDFMAARDHAARDALERAVEAPPEAVD